MPAIFLILLFIFSSLTGSASAPETEALNYPALTTAFTTQNGIIWSKPEAVSLRQQLVTLVDNSTYKGLHKTRYHTEMLHSASSAELEKYYVDAAITYCKDMVAAPGGKWLSYDELTGKTIAQEDAALLAKLAKLRRGADLLQLVTDMEPGTTTYRLMITALAIQMEAQNTLNVAGLKTSLQYYRWIHHFRFQQYVVVNIASASLQYFEGDEAKLSMKVVVGKPATKTPRFAAYCHQLILYPYWHVPRSIAVNEILPKAKKNAGAINKLNLQVLGKNGKTISPYAINWKQYSKANFPFTFRQPTGCDNALGVIKFDLTSPYSVYLHDTNVRSVFVSVKRYLSHGCIRVEKPMELANSLYPAGIDTNFLNACVKGQQSQKIAITPVPVFVVYMPVEATEQNELIYLDDIYKLL